MGSSVALHLALSSPKTRIVVVERDASYKQGSAMLSAGGIRQQFSVEENVLSCIYGASFIKNIGEICRVGDSSPDVQFHEHGYLYLAKNDSKSRQILEVNHATQVRCGADWMKLLNVDDLSKQFPWLNVDGLGLGSYGTKNEGYFDPWSFVNAMKAKAQSLGVVYVEGTVVGAKTESVSSSSSRSIVSIDVREKSGGSRTIASGVFVNAAGAWAGKLVDLIASQTPRPSAIHPLPVRPRKRCIFTVHCSAPTHISEQQQGKPRPPPSTPLVIDPSGCYFRPEGGGGRFIMGVSPLEDNDPDCTDDGDLQHIDQALFNDVLWPTLSERVPAFESIKQTGAWAGFYEVNTLDQNAIIGHHSELSNLVLCNGFSGHGLQQAPAAGRAVAELVLHKSFQTIDLKRWSFERIVDKKPIFETGIV